MKLLNVRTKLFEEAEVSEVEKSDLITIQKGTDFVFDWKKERSISNVYKIYLLSDVEVIQGLISMQDIKKEFRIHINLIELSRQNIGRDKLYDRVAGCLLAYACEAAFDKSYGGFVSLLPKTALIEHYCRRYGFQQFGRQLAVDYEASLALVKKYT